MESEKNRRGKYEEKNVRVNEYRLIDLNSCESFVCSVLTFGMYHINNLKFKELWVLFCYHFRLESLKGIPKKLELVEAVTDLFRRD